MTARPAGVCAVLLAGVLLAGCARFRKAKECDVLAKTVSGWLGRQPTPNTASAEPAALADAARATAKRYQELDRELAALEIKSRELAPRVQRYRQLAVDSAHALEDVARGLDAKDTELARKRRVEFDVTVRSEAPLVAEINAICRR